MKLDRKSLERGLQRLYYVLWGLFVSIFLVGVAAQEMRGLPRSEGELALFWASVFLIVVAVPWLVLILIRWIYRGFVSS